MTTAPPSDPPSGAPGDRPDEVPAPEPTATSADTATPRPPRKRASGAESPDSGRARPARNTAADTASADPTARPARKTSAGATSSGTKPRTASGTAKTGTAKPGTAKTGTAKTGTAKAGGTRPSATKAGTATRGSAKAGTTKAGTTKTGTTKTGTAKTGTAKTGTARTGTARTGTAKTGAAKVARPKTGAATAVDDRPAREKPAKEKPAKEKSAWRKRGAEKDSADPAAPHAAASVTTADDAPPAETAGGEPLRGRRLQYMPELDGLRGLGVMLMLAYHCEMFWVSENGILPLETFFVMSGFLITTLLIIERERTDKIDIKEFWARRGRRLVPAVMGAIVIVSVYAVVFAQPLERAKIRDDGITSLLYVNNWAQIFSGESYFQKYANPSPLRHMWSLSVEEQFYLIVAMGFAFAFRKWGPKARYWPWVTGGLAVLSAAWSLAIVRFSLNSAARAAETQNALTVDRYADWPEWLRTFLAIDAQGDFSRAHFGTDTRFQSIMIGATAAFLARRFDLTKVPGKVWAAVGAIGTLLIEGLAVMPTSNRWLYYGGFFFFDIVVAATIVAFLVPHNSPIRKLLNWRPVVWIGLMSYSLYVYHLPVFAFFTESRVPFRGWVLNVVKLAVTFAVSTASYYLYESGIRKAGLKTRRRLGIALGGIAVIVAGLVFSTADDQAAATIGQSQGSAAGAPRVMVAGDSQAFSLSEGLLAMGADRKTGFDVATAGVLGCGISPANHLIEGRQSVRNPSCESWHTDWPIWTEQYQPQVSLLLSWGWEIQDRWMYAADGSIIEMNVGTPEWHAYLTTYVNQAVDALQTNGGYVGLVTFPCLDLEADTSVHAPEEAAQPHRVASVNDVIREVAASRNDGTFVVELNQYLCPDGSHFEAVIDDVRITDDTEHFTPEGADKLWVDLFAPTIRANVPNLQ